MAYRTKEEKKRNIQKPLKTHQEIQKQRTHTRNRRFQQQNQKSQKQHRKKTHRYTHIRTGNSEQHNTRTTSSREQSHANTTLRGTRPKYNEHNVQKNKRETYNIQRNRNQTRRQQN